MPNLVTLKLMLFAIYIAAGAWTWHAAAKLVS